MLEIIDNPHNVLKRVYGFDEFRDNQLDMISAGLNGKDVLGILTTGGGKSLCFQVPALCVNGTTLVVSPIISLMKDQVDRLRSMGIKAGYLSSSMEAEETSKELFNFSNNNYKLFYVSPERLQSAEFQERLKQVNLSFLAIDESHCVSVWGHDFRPSFKHIRPEVEKIEQFIGRRLPRLAYTATATEDVRNDIIKQLGMDDPYTFVGGFDRTNIEINVRRSTNKNADLHELLNQIGKEPTIIYCSTVKSVNAVHDDLEKMGFSVGKYNGQMKGVDKNRSQEAFLNGEINVMVATNAFGMGIDKSDIRNIIHYQMPGNIENYFQEAGRAGRDGADSKAFILYHENDIKLQEFFIENTFPESKLIDGVRHVLNSFARDGVVSVNARQIMQAAPDNIDLHKVNSALRILDDQGHINITVLDNDYENMNIELAEIEKDIDYDYIEDRRKNSMSKLEDMSAFCRTNLCRRRFVLRYFGEKQGHKNCGNCDRCNHHNKEMARHNQVIPEETVKNVLNAISELNGAIEKKVLFDVMMGVNSFAIKRRKLDGIESFGILKNWTKVDAESLVKKIEEEGFIKFSLTKEETTSLTKNGLKALHGDLGIKIDATSKYQSSDNVAKAEKQTFDKSSIKTKTVFDPILYEKLVSLRKYLAKEHEKPPMMVCSDKVLQNMATMKPENNGELTYCGLRAGPSKIFGAKFIENIKKYEEPNKKQDLESELDNF